MSASRATETDAIEFFLNHPGMYIDPQSQPTQAGNDECWKNLLRRTSVLGHICESMHDGRSHLDATPCMMVVPISMQLVTETPMIRVATSWGGSMKLIVKSWSVILRGS